MSSEASEGESLRFLLGDVVKVKALFPSGNKARQKGVEEQGQRRTCTREHRRYELSRCMNIGQSSANELEKGQLPRVLMVLARC